MNDATRHAKSIAGAPVRHESAHLHVAGGALYTDDIALPVDTLHAAFGISPVAHARITALDLDAVAAAPGVVAIAGAADVPGENNYGSILHDDPIFAEALVQYAGQPLFAVAATTRGAARKAAMLARVEFEELPAILDVRAALAANSFIMPSKRIVRGDAASALQAAPRRLSGSITIGGQDHFYLEGQIAIAVPQEDSTMLVHCNCATGCKTSSRARAAHAVTVRVPAHGRWPRRAKASRRCRRRRGAGDNAPAGQAAPVATPTC